MPNRSTLQDLRFAEKIADKVVDKLGGCREIKNKFLFLKPSKSSNITDNNVRLNCRKYYITYHKVCFRGEG